MSPGSGLSQIAGDALLLPLRKVPAFACAQTPGKDQCGSGVLRSNALISFVFPVNSIAFAGKQQ